MFYIDIYFFFLFRRFCVIFFVFLEGGFFIFDDFGKFLENFWFLFEEVEEDCFVVEFGCDCKKEIKNSYID